MTVRLVGGVGHGIDRRIARGRPRTSGHLPVHQGGRSRPPAISSTRQASGPYPLQPGRLRRGRQRYRDVAHTVRCRRAGSGHPKLHAKLYLFGASRAVITSASLTKSALDRNHGFGLVAEDAPIIATCRAYFDDL